MTTDSLTAPFTKIALFDGLAAEHLQRIARTAERIVFQPGDVIQTEHDIPEAAILIVSGKALAVEDPSDEKGETIPAGSLVGELAMIIPSRAVTTVVARSSVRAFRITRDDMRQIMEDAPAIADHLIEKISGRLNVMAAEMRRVDKAIANAVDRLPHTIATDKQPTSTLAMH